MRRIRTKLVLSLLIVTMIPVLSSYYLVRGLVNHTLEVIFSKKVETAIEGAAGISRDLYARYREEALGTVVELAGSASVMQTLENGRGGALADAFSALGTCRVDIYDEQANLVDSFSNMEEEEPDDEAEGKDSPGAEETRKIFIGGEEIGHTDVGKGTVPDFSREQLVELSQKTEAEILEGSDDPGYVSVFAPVVAGGNRLGFIVVVKALEKEFAQFARLIVDVNQNFKILAYSKEELRYTVLIFFAFCFAFMAILSVGVGYVFSRLITSPLLKLVDGTQMVAAGDLDYRIKVSSRDEIGQLMDSFNKMIASIKENQRIARERELERQRAEEESRRRAKDLEMSELRTRALQAENERQTIELEKSQELEKAYQELEESHQQLKEAQAQLILQEKMASLGSMVAGVAHEINNPMGVVNSATDVSGRCIDRIEGCVAGTASIAELRESDSFQQAVHVLKDNVEVARQAGERITKLVQSLRRFARLDEAEFQMADLREGLDSTLNLLHQQIGPDVEVIREYADIPLTYCSPGQLNQVFMNVLKNAAQAIDGSGVIRIVTFQEGGEIGVRISDTGAGIPPEQLDRIFDLRLSAKSSRVKMGSGLSMAYRIVQEHGGRIEIESQVEKGTEVTIRLPAREGRQE